MLRIGKVEAIGTLVAMVLVAVAVFADRYLEANLWELSSAGQWARWVEVLSGESK